MLTDKQVDAVVDWMRGLAYRGPNRIAPLSELRPNVVEAWRQGVREAIAKAKT